MRILSYTGPSGDMPPGDQCLTLQTGNFYFGTSGYYSSGTDIRHFAFKFKTVTSMISGHTHVLLAQQVYWLIHPVRVSNFMGSLQQVGIIHPALTSLPYGDNVNYLSHNLKGGSSCD